MLFSYSDSVPFYLIVSLGLAALLSLAFRFASAPGARNKTLVALRAGSLGFLVLILTNPVRVREEKHAGPEPTAVFLLDRSRSMSLETPISRSLAVDQFISRADSLLSTDRRPAIQKYGFGRELSAIAEARKIASRHRRRNALDARARAVAPAPGGDVAVRNLRLLRRSLDRAGYNRSDRPRLPGAGRADPRRAGGRRADLGGRGRAGHRRPARRPALGRVSRSA